MRHSLKLSPGRVLQSNLNDVLPKVELLIVCLLYTCFHYQVYIIGHIPPGFFEKKRSKPWYTPKFNKLYLDLIQKHHSVILGQFFGHHHTDSFRMFYNSGGKVRVTATTNALPCVASVVIYLFFTLSSLDCDAEWLTLSVQMSPITFWHMILW